MAKYHDDLVADVRKRQEEGMESKIHVDEKTWWSSLPHVLLFYAKGYTGVEISFIMPFHAYLHCGFNLEACTLQVPPQMVI